MATGHQVEATATEGTQSGPDGQDPQRLIPGEGGDLQINLSEAGGHIIILGPPSPEGLPNQEALERALVTHAVRLWPTQKREIAEALGMCLATLYNRLDQYGLDTDAQPLYPGDRDGSCNQPGTATV